MTGISIRSGKKKVRGRNNEVVRSKAGFTIDSLVVSVLSLPAKI